MFRNAVSIIVLFALAVAGCAAGSSKPGMDGTSIAKRIEVTNHPVIPDGVVCFVCHKEDIPQFAFHAGYGNKCSGCHAVDTWMAKEYPHPGWYLNTVHRTRCNRCHTGYQSHDFFTYQCFGCHHESAAITQLHTDRENFSQENCITCHKDVRKSD